MAKPGYEGGVSGKDWGASIGAEPPINDSGIVIGPASATDGNLAVFDGTDGKKIKDGGSVPGGGGGSLLSANTARVDSSGNDSTGTIGDLTKPFLTVQAAINAFVALSDSSTQFVIDFGDNQFAEDLTIASQLNLVFRGTCPGSSAIGYGPVPFQTLTLTASAIITVKDCQMNGATVNTSDDLDFILYNVDTGGVNVASTAGNTKHLTVASPNNSAWNFQFIEADDIGTLTVIGVSILPGNGGEMITVSNSAAIVEINNCGFSPFADGQYEGNEYLFTVNCPNSDVIVMDSVVWDVTASKITLLNSKALGTVTTSSIYPPAFVNDQGEYDFDYDFARDGGAQGTIVLTPSNGSKGVSLPLGFVVTRAILEIVTPLDSVGHSATTALTSGESAGDLQSATIVSGAPWSTAGLKSLAALIKTTGTDAPAIVVAVEDLTAGKFTLHIDGYIAP